MKKHTKDVLDRLKGKTKVAIEEVRRIQRERQAINKLNFDDIIWTYKGKDLVIDPKVLADWELTGLNNMDFITSNAWHHLEIDEEQQTLILDR